MKRTCVLLIEDDIDDAAIVEREYSLTEFFDVTHTVRSVESAIAYLEGRGAYVDRVQYRMPEVLLLDMKLGLGSGLEIVRWVRSQERLKRIPIVALTGSKNPREIDEGYGAGINSYIAKPADMVEMTRILRAIGQYWSQCAVLPGGFR